MDQWTNTEDLITGYKSPIEIIMGQMRMEQENETYRVVQSYGVNVDKDELIRALQYDRGQYEKGYADGLRHRESEWISVEDDTPKNSMARVQVFLRNTAITDGIGFPKIDTDRFIDGKWVRWSNNVTHWMPLPEPPKMKGANDEQSV